MNERAAAERQAEAAADYVRRRWPRRPVAAIVLGTGLSQLAGRMSAEVEIGYDELPHFHRPTAIGHRGRLVCGELHGAPVIAFAGRCHLYEGFSPREVTLPTRTAHCLGAGELYLSNASGGVNPQLATGEIVVIDDHVNLMWRRAPLGGQPRAKGRPYDDELAEVALNAARRRHFSARRGVYVGVTGPNYETRAEYRCFRRVGGDVVGMSTIPEATTAATLGMRVLALSVVTNVARPDAPHVVDAEEVVHAAEAAEPRVSQIVVEVLRRGR